MSIARRWWRPGPPGPELRPGYESAGPQGPKGLWESHFSWGGLGTKVCLRWAAPPPQLWWSCPRGPEGKAPSEAAASACSRKPDLGREQAGVRQSQKWKQRAGRTQQRPRGEFLIDISKKKKKIGSGTHNVIYNDKNI